MHTKAPANLLSLATRDACIYHDKVTTDVRAHINSALPLMVMLMIMRMVVLTSTVHANAANTMTIRALHDDNANVVPSREEVETTVTPVSLHLRVVGIATIASTIVEDWSAGVPKKNTIIVDGKAITRTVQVSNVHDTVTVKVKHDRRDAADITKGKVHPATIDG